MIGVAFTPKQNVCFLPSSLYKASLNAGRFFYWEQDGIMRAMQRRKLRVRRIVLLGPQGSGKGTQAELLAERLGVPKITTGEIYRAEIAKGTPLGRRISAIIDRGNLMPDAFTNQVMREWLSRRDARRGYVLDGYPRTMAQARSLARSAPPDVVVLLTLSDYEAIRRLRARRISRCGATFNMLSAPPKRDEMCDVCGEKLTRRADDTVAGIRRRLTLYKRQTHPVIAYYQREGILIEVRGRPPVEEVFREIKEKLTVWSS